MAHGKIDEIKRLHYRLMVVYLYTLESLSLPGPLGGAGSDQPKQSNPPTGTLAMFLSFYRLLAKLASKINHDGRIIRHKPASSYRHRPITRVFVESHIRSRLSDLRAAYAQLEQVLPENDRPSDLAKWLSDAQDSISRFTSTLTVASILRRLLRATWLAIAGLVSIGVISKTFISVLEKDITAVTGSDSSWVGFSIAAVYLALAAVYFIVGGTTGKRNLFLKPISITSTWPGVPGGLDIDCLAAENVYSAEDELFACIGRSKRPEAPLDEYCLSAALFGGSVALDYLAIRVYEPRLKAVFALIAIVLLYYAVKFSINGSRRRPR